MSALPQDKVMGKRVQTSNKWFWTKNGVIRTCHKKDRTGHRPLVQCTFLIHILQLHNKVWTKFGRSHLSPVKCMPRVKSPALDQCLAKAETSGHLKASLSTALQYSMTLAQQKVPQAGSQHYLSQSLDSPYTKVPFLMRFVSTMDSCRVDY